MSRTRKQKFIEGPPLFTAFKPMGVSCRKDSYVSLSLDEFEAVRLADYQGLDHAEAAEQMGTSRSTFSRLVMRARHKMAAFMIDGRQLVIEGGNIDFRCNVIQCQDCGSEVKVKIDSNVCECAECSSQNITKLADRFSRENCCKGGNHS